MPRPAPTDAPAPVPRPGRGLLVATLVALVTGLWPAAARADIEISPFIGLAFGGNTTIVDLDRTTGVRKIAYGISVTFLSKGIVGFEADLGTSPGFFQRESNASLVNGSSVTTLMANGVLTLPARKTRYSLRPYASGGLGLIRPYLNDELDVFHVDRNLLGLNVGGGAVGFFTDQIGVRWDLRYFRALAGPAAEDPISIGTTRLDFWRATMGIVLRY